MQDDTGIKKILTLSWAYKLFKAMIGARQSNIWLTNEFWKPQPGQKILDIGCGPGVTLDNLPAGTRYVGFDISEEYIAHAREKFRGDPDKIFVVGVAEDFLEKLPEEMRDADLVIMNGLLHHLDDDQATTALRLAHRAMAPHGRLICLEGCFLMRQAWMDRWLLERDRGQNVRSETQWKALVRRVFDDFDTHILTGLIRIPYTHIVIEARKTP